MKVNFKQLLAQLAALVFVINTTLAHGACCFEVQPEPTAAEQSAVSPCHDVSESELDSSSTNCCVACVPAIPMTQLSAANTAESPSFPLALNTSVWASEVAQRFRPPISA